MFDPFDSPTFRLMRSLQKQQEKMARLADPFGFASQTNKWAKLQQSIIGTPLGGILEANALNKAILGGVDPLGIGAADKVARSVLHQSPLQKLIEQNQQLIGASVAARAVPSDVFTSKITAISSTLKLFEETGIAKIVADLRPTFSALEAAQSVMALGKLAAGIPEFDKIAPIIPRTLEVLRADPERYRDPEARAELQRELTNREGTESGIDPNVFALILSMLLFLWSYTQAEVNDFWTTDKLMDLEAEMKREAADREHESQHGEEEVAKNRELLLRLISMLEPVSSGCVVELTTKSPAKAGKSPSSVGLGHFREGQSVLLLQIHGRRALVRGELNGEEVTAWIAKKKLPKDGRCSLAEVFKVPRQDEATPK